MATNKTKLVQHVNMIAGWEHPKQREIYCKRQHKILPVEIETCEMCPYFVTAGQGDVIVCGWEDIPPIGGDTKVIQQYNAKNEFYRVSGLIDSKVITKG